MLGGLLTPARVLPSGSGPNLRQTEGREFLWAKGGGQTGDPHQDGGHRRGESHWQGRQDGELAAPLPDVCVFALDNNWKLSVNSPAEVAD